MSKIATGHEDIFVERAISPEVVTARRYVRYEQGDVATMDTHYGGLLREVKSNLTHEHNIARQCGGYLICRRPMPGMDFEIGGSDLRKPDRRLYRIYPEFRPDFPVRTKPPMPHTHDPREHDFRDHIAKSEEPPDVDAFRSGKLDLFRYYRDRGLDYSDDGIQYRRHADGSVGLYIWAHNGRDTGLAHYHERFPKYVFPSYGKNGDRSLPLAARVDVHPDAVDLIKTSNVVYLGIEGCMKADAMLSAGAAVASVPAVGQWGSPELKRFTSRYLKGKTVIVVPDGDWATKTTVLGQATCAALALRRYGAGRVHIAAPDVDVAKGVDDWLASGRKLEEMLVIDRDEPEGIDRFCYETFPRDAEKRNAEILRALSVTADRDGFVKVGARALGRASGLHPDVVRTGLEQLEKVEAIRGEMVEWENYWTGRIEWRAVYTVDDEWRSPQSEPMDLATTLELDSLCRS